ncbi:MAG: MBOAT family O-acyltransferase [Clostridia bacterium]
MVFSSSEFLFCFLPLVMLVYFLLKKRTHRNMFLMGASLVFYAWGEPWFVFVMLFSILVNWFAGLMIGKYALNPKKKKLIVMLAVVFNLALLGVFKYLMFVMNNVNWAFGLHMPVPQIILPIGISFFTFQAMSYVIDVYRGDGQVQKSFWNVCLYVSFFPQLIAGPIVRYQTIADEIENRQETLSDFEEGARRFLVGLAKKVLLANNLALLADSAFALKTGELSVLSAWLGAIAYLWQVYFDFSGYSDMAIGMGRMFGFHFLENFNFPMISRTVTEFWSRWHISLGTWFRDYLYFPLGGSRVCKSRAVFNMFVVWSLTGLWHGAAWTYLLWGVGFFVLLALEKFTPLGKWMAKHPIGHVYAMVAITTVTVLIRSANMTDAMAFVGAMYGAAGHGLFDATAGMYLREYGFFVLAALIVALPVGPFVQRVLHIPESAMELLRGILLALGFLAALTYIVMGGYNPFIYFNF